LDARSSAASQRRAPISSSTMWREKRKQSN
jgi:hypothetical protein